MMKKYMINCAAVLSLLTAFASCTDLDTDVKSQYTQLPLSEAAVDAVSGSVYTSLNSAFGQDLWLASILSSDEASAVAMGKDYYDAGRYMELTLHTWTAANPIISTVWDELMNGVVKSNNVIAQIGDEESELAAPVRAMRAFFYFELMDNFGDVPLIKSFGDEAQRRASRAEVAEYVESELLAVRSQLTEESSETTYGKANRWMVEALLAKLYLNWAVYTSSDVATYEPSSSNAKLDDCVEACNNIIASGLFSVNDDYRSKFLPTNGSRIKDFIFVVPFDHLLQRGMTYNRWWNFRDGRDMWGFTIPESVAGILRLNPAYVDKFSIDGDRRNDVLLGGKINKWSNFEQTDEPYVVKTTQKAVDAYYDGADEDVEWQVEMPNELYIRNEEQNASTLNIGNDLIGKAMGWRCIKFYVDPQTTKEDGRSQSNDVPIFRYADVLLMKAEALLRGAKDTEGATPTELVNEVRNASNAGDLASDATLDDLIDERAREFVDEVWRRNDLIRFGLFEVPTSFREKYSPVETAQAFRRVFCIPQGVLNTNASWSQNAGY